MNEDWRERFRNLERRRIRRDLERLEAGEKPKTPNNDTGYGRPGTGSDSVPGNETIDPYLAVRLRAEMAEMTEIPEPEPEAPEEPRRRKKHIIRKLFTLLILLLLALGLAFFTVVYFFASRMDYQPYAAIQEDPAWNLPAEGKENVVNILLIGTDARVRNTDSRSDTIILCSICPKKKKICLTSILRDSYTEIPGYGRNRINHAYQMGGARLLAETIEMNFHIRIDHYVKVDFFSFVDIIDSLGGVDVEIAENEVQYLNAYLCDVNLLTGRPAEEDFLSGGGNYRLTGRQALAYARIRYIGTDFGRTGRQRTILLAAAKAVRRAPLKAAAALNRILPDLVTDLPELEMTLLLMRLPLFLSYEITGDQIPYDGTWQNDTMPNGQEVLNMDFDSVSRILRERLYRN